MGITVPGLILSILSGLLLWAAFPPVNFAAAAWFALAPLFIALLRFAPTRFSYGLYYGLTFLLWFTGMIIGLPPDYKVLYAVPVLLSILAFLFTFWQKDLQLKNNARFFTAITASLFLSFEFIRRSSPIGLFGVLGMSQYRHPEVIQISSLLGSYSVSFSIVVANCTIALALANWKNLDRVKLHLAVNSAILISFFVINYHIWETPPPVIRTVKAAAVQFGYVPEAEKHPEFERWGGLGTDKTPLERTYTVLDILIPMTWQAASGGAQLVVWPECILEVDPVKTPDVRARLSDLAVKTGIHLVVPYYVEFPKQKNQLYPESVNGAWIVAPDGRFAFHYLKQHRVVSFGIEAGPVGDRSDVFDSGLGKIGLMICYDSDYPDVPAKYAAGGATYFIVPSHDLAGFLTRHHPAMLMLRGVELRRSMIKSDYVNGTLISDPRGVILADPPDGLGMAVADVPLTSAKTLSPVLSTILGICSMVFLPVFLFLARMRK